MEIMQNPVIYTPTTYVMIIDHPGILRLALDYGMEQTRCLLPYIYEGVILSTATGQDVDPTHIAELMINSDAISTDTNYIRSHREDFGNLDWVYSLVEAVCESFPEQISPHLIAQFRNKPIGQVYDVSFLNHDSVMITVLGLRS